MLEVKEIFTDILDNILGSRYIRKNNYILESEDGQSTPFGLNIFKQRLNNKSNQPINDTARDALISCFRYKLKLNKTNKGTVYENNAIETANKLCDFLEGNNLFDCSELRNIQIMAEDPDNKHKRELLLIMFQALLNECMGKEFINKKKTKIVLEDTFALIAAKVTADIVSNPNYENKPSGERLENMYQKGLFSVNNCTNIQPKTRIPQPVSHFIGREDELSSLQNSIAENGYAILEGLPGIGKSEIAKKYIKEAKEKYDIILWLIYDESIEYTLFKTPFPLDEFHKGESVEDAYERKIEKLINQNKKTLIIVDNCDTLPYNDNKLDEFLTYDFDVILTTRLSFDDSIKISNIKDVGKLYELFINFCTKFSSPEYKASIIELINTLQGHTLLIELYAKLISRSDLDLSKALKLANKNVIISNETNIKIKKDDKTISNQLKEHITSLLGLKELQSKLDYRKQTYLAIASLLPLCGLYTEDVHNLCGYTDNNSLYELNDLGWISVKDDIVYVHPLIRDSLLHHFVNDSQLLTNIINRIIPTIGLNDATGKIFTNPKIYNYCELLFNVFSKLRFNSREWITFCTLAIIYLCEAGFGRNAIILFKNTKENAQQERKTHWIEYVTLLCYGANIYQHLGQYDYALTEINDCISQIEKNPSLSQNILLTDNCYAVLAQFYVDSGNISKAKEVFDKKVSISYKNSDSTYADVLFYYNHKEEEIVRRNVLKKLADNTKYYAEQAAKLANCLGKQGRYDECIQWHDLAYNLLLKLGFEGTPDIADALYSYAVSLCDIRQYEAAIEKLLISYEIYSKNLDNYKSNIIDVEYILAEAYAQSSDYFNAEHFILECLEHHEQLLADNPNYINSNYANQLFFTGTLYKNQSQYKKAIPYFEKCEQVFNGIETKSAMYFLEYTLCYDLAICYYTTCEYSKVISYVKKALSLKEYKSIDELIQKLILLQLFIDSLLKNEKINQAFEKTEYAISLWNKHEKELASDPNPSSIPSKFSFYYDQFLCCMYSDVLYSQKDDIAQSAINCINDAHIPEQDFSQYKNLLSLWGTSLIRDQKYNKGFEITKKYLNLIDIENEKNQFTEIAIHSMINYYTYKNDLEMVNYYKNIQENLFD